MILPNFIIAGTKKAATTSMYEYLKQHPQVYMSPIKETKFFAFEPENAEHVQANQQKFPVRTLDEYGKLFVGAQNKVAIGEASPVYINSSHAMQQIYATLPQVKLIFSLRDPVERAYSAYLMRVRGGYESRPVQQAFQEDLAHLREVTYYNRLKEWYTLFDRQQIKIVLYEDFKKDAAGVMRELYQFVGVDPSFVPDTAMKHMEGGVAKSQGRQKVINFLRRYRSLRFYLPQSVRNIFAGFARNNLDKAPPMPAEVRKLLTDLYREDVVQLQMLIQRDLKRVEYHQFHSRGQQRGKGWGAYGNGREVSVALLMKKVILVGGTPFSGSTIFHMMLANAPQGLAIGEVKSLFLPVLAKHMTPECSCEEPNCSFWNKVRQQGVDRLYETIFELRPEIEVIVDSSKFPFWIDRQNKQLPSKGIQVENVLIWKTPVEYAASCWKRREIFPRNWQQWARDWVDYHRLYLSLVENWRGVQYANLAANSEQTLTAVGEYLGLPYFPGKERFWEQPQHVLFGNRAARGVPKARETNQGEQKSKTRATLPASVAETIDREAAFVDLQKTLLQCDILWDKLAPLHGKANGLTNGPSKGSASGVESLQAQRLSWPMIEYRRLRAATLTTIGHYKYGNNLP